MSSSSILISIPTAMNSAVTQMALLFKPLNLNLGRDSGRAFVPQQLNPRRVRLLNSVMPLRCSTSSGGTTGHHDDAILLHVGGMMCEGCAANVKRILESRPQVSSATVNLASETALVSPSSEEKTAPNWQQQLGETLAHHLTTCGFTSTLQVAGQEDSG